jgi:hypothetical protein
MASKTLERVRIGVSPLTERVYVGTLRNDHEWRNKVDRTNDFLAALLEWCPAGYEREIVGSDGRVFFVTVQERAAGGAS